MATEEVETKNNLDFLLKKHVNVFNGLIEELHKDINPSGTIDDISPDRKYVNLPFQSEEIEQFLLNNNEDTRLILMRNQDVQNYLRRNLTQYSEFIQTVFLQINSKQDLLDVIKYENVFPKAIVEQEVFYKIFLNDLLLPLIDLNTKLNSECFEEISRIIQKCIFHRNFKKFQDYLNCIFQVGETPSKFPLAKALMKFLKSSYNKKEGCCGFKLIFHSFSYYKEFDLSYKLFVILLELIGFDLNHHFNMVKTPKHIEINTNTSQSILLGLFDVLAKNQSRPDHKINEIAFIDFMRNILKSFISQTKKPSPQCYKILMKAIEINPLIIEPIITEIITYTMLANHQNAADDYEILLNSIFEVFAKLHRIQSLIAKMIPALKAQLDKPYVVEAIYEFRGTYEFDSETVRSYTVDSVFPKKCLHYFTDCITNLASWQVMNLFKTLLFHLDAAVVDLDNIKNDSKKLFYLEILGTLTCWLLASVRLAEHTVTTTVTEKFVTSLGELRSILKKFGTTLVHREHNHVLMRVYLSICYHWAEIYLLLSNYSINNEVSITTNSDNDASACNITYLHSYLNLDEWSIISERITNFGEKSSKEMMHKLLVQKLRAAKILQSPIGDEMVHSVVNIFNLNFDEISMDLLMDKFVLNHIVPALPSSQIINMAECILFGNIDKLKEAHIYDCKILTNAMICVVFAKLCKLFKQKRKLDDYSCRKTLLCKIYSILPNDIFSNDDVVGDYLSKSREMFANEICNVEMSDLKMKEEKINDLLTILTKLPVIFCDESPLKLVIVLLFALHKDVTYSNCDNLKNNCENVIIGITQFNKFILIDIFEQQDVQKFMIEHFNRYEELFINITQNIFRNENDVLQFVSSILFVKDNLKDNKYLKCAVLVLNLLTKGKKMKISPETKNSYSEFRSTICKAIVKMIGKKDVEINLIEPYAIVLNKYATKDDGKLNRLMEILEDYMNFALLNPNENIKGNLLLFSTVLRHKSVLNFPDSTLKIWNCCKCLKIGNQSEEYSQLIILIITLIPNDEFSNVTNDLFEFTVKSLEDHNVEEFGKNLNTWTSILACNFNSIKTKVLQDILELLLQKLISFLNTEFVQAISQLAVAVIQTNLLLLTPLLVDLLLVFPTVLMLQQSHDSFDTNYGLAIRILESLLRTRKELIMDRLPPYLQQYRILLGELCSRGNSDLDLNASRVQFLADCAHQLEKLTKNLVACSRDMTRIAPYLIGDILAQYESVTLYPNIKLHLNNCIYSLISLCDQHAVSFLMRVLSNASTEIFKFMYENYKKYYRFTGKV